MGVWLRSRLGAGAGFWTPHLVSLAWTVFLISFGTGLLTAANTNFFVETLQLQDRQVLWLTGLREIPGLALIFIAAMISRLPLTRRAAYAVILMGIGYALYTLVQSYTALVSVAIVASLGFHVWMPLQSSLGMSLVGKEHSGRVMGSLSAVGALATIVGMGGVALLASFITLRTFNALGGALMVLAGMLLLRLPQRLGETHRTKQRLQLKKRYWLYYVLTFFEGSRIQVFGAFGTLILVSRYGLSASQISLLLLGSGLANLIAAPYFGRMLDHLGERTVLSVSYVALAFCFVGFATIHNAWALGALLIGINLLTMLSIGLSTYVSRIAPPEELEPTLSAGVSVNHITSVGMSLVAGTLLQVVGYEALCWGASTIILLSVPFALAIRTQREPSLQPSVASAE